MSKRKSLNLTLPSLLFALSLLIAVLANALSRDTYAATSPVVINELMYNPGSGNQDDEFLELYNTTDQAIDLEGWCFTQGITLCFSAGVSIEAEDYLIISPNSSRTQTTYSLTPTTVYSGNLSNGGETLTLRDDSNAIVTSITYSDAPPWPSTPDGEGPSLELRSPEFDGNVATSWLASISSATPNAENSVFGLEAPTISNVGHGSVVQVDDSPFITANVDDATEVELVYKVMYGAEQTLTMHDDGLNGDGGANDGVYGVAIPSQVAGTLVRYKVVADNSGEGSSWPGASDTINYAGYVVQSEDLSGIPTFNWYMDPTDYEDMVTNHLADEEQFPTVVAFGGKVIDNALVRVKGNSNLYKAKKKFKFELPQGHLLGDPYFEHPVDEFALNATIINVLNLSEELAWEVAREAGTDLPQMQRVDVTLNTDSNPQESRGMYLFIETYDGNWRERNGYEEGAFYKAAVDKKTRLDEDDSDIQELMDNLQNLSGDELKTYILDNLDVASFINFDATMVVARNFDWTFHQNMFQYRDTEGTERWSIVPDDLDVAMAPIYLEDLGGFIWDYSNFTTKTRLVGGAMYQFPEFQEAYNRRVSEIFERVYGGGDNNKFKAWVDAIHQESAESIDNDHAIWGPSRDVESEVSDYMKDFPVDSPLLEPYETFGEVFSNLDSETTQKFYWYDIERSKEFMANSRQAGTLPNPQPADARVLINELNYNPPGGGDYEYLELYNPNNYAVDVSGWQFSSGINLTIQGGAVIPAKSYGLVVNKDTVFRGHYGGGKHVIAEYGGNLSNEGETITLQRSDGSIASSVSYQISDPWPGSANGGGASLALTDEEADLSLASCWAPGLSGGTPGLANTPDEAWVEEHGSGCIVEDVDPSNPTPTEGGSTGGVSLGAILNRLQRGLSSIQQRLTESGVIESESIQPEDTESVDEAKKDSKASDAQKAEDSNDDSGADAWKVLLVSVGLLGGIPLLLSLLGRLSASRKP